MAFFQSEQNDQRSAGLSLNSNNPFRNRDRTSPTTSGPLVSPFDDPPPRPTSRNPFLDIGAANNGRPTSQTNRSVSDTMSGFGRKPSATAEDIFASLTLDDRPSGSKPPPPPPAARRPVPPPAGRENAKPRGPPPAHRPSRSQEEDLRARKTRGTGNSGTLIDLDSPPQQRRTERRPRRNSDTSILDLTEDEREKRARDARRRERERERRHRENKEKKPTNRKLDIIDQLDATSIYGTGMFHHDGPFDALNPHRNKNGSRRPSPMEAFPEGSLNNTLGGAGPLNPRPDHATFMGQHDEEAYRDWTQRDKNLPSKNELPVFDPTSRGSAMHGDESLGLGTSTFLEGTPAARTAIQQRHEELAQELTTNGLARKKSLAHRIRNINKGPREREFQSLGRLNSTDYNYAGSPPAGGGRTSNSMSTPNSERNPFFSEYSQGKGGEEGFSVRKADSSSPRGHMERRATTDAAMTLEEGQQKPTGLLGRMKSLKGGRRTRPAPPGPEAGPVPSQYA